MGVMIRIEIRKTASGEHRGFTCKGHAEYADNGKDIICAAVSMLVINTMNSLDELAHEKLTVHSDEKSGIIECQIEETISDAGRVLMDSFELGCKGIIDSYGTKYVKVKYKEV